MALYATLFSYTSATWEKMTAHPSDRAAAVAAVAEELGGSLVALYYMIGPYDGISLVDLPDGSAAAAISTVATATGAYRHFDTYPLIESSALPAVLTRARTVGERFARPGDSSGGGTPKPQGSGR